MINPFKKKTICSNMQTAGNLINYLKLFPKDAKVILHLYTKDLGYHDVDCVIGCNFENQKEKNTVTLIPGFFIERKGAKK